MAKSSNNNEMSSERMNQDEISNRDEDCTKQNTTPATDSFNPNPNNNPNPTLRTVVGGAVVSLSDTINDNIILARYGTMATCTGLVLYGLWKTPLFFRYKRVSDIPSQYFQQRKVLHGRLVHVVPPSSDSFNGSREQPVVCLVRHLSPMGRWFFTRSSFEYAARNSPSSRLQSSIGNGSQGKMSSAQSSSAGIPLEHANDLLQVELAGVKYLQGYNELDDLTKRQRMEWLQRLVANRTPVSCKLISRRQTGSGSNIDDEMQQSAICQVHYRPNIWNIFGNDLAPQLVRSGALGVSTTTMHIPDNSTDSNKKSAILDASQDAKTIRSDIRYLESLRSEEMEAIQKKVGLWSNEQIRQHYSDLVEESDLEASGGLLRKLWRKLVSKW